MVAQQNGVLHEWLRNTLNYMKDWDSAGA